MRCAVAAKWSVRCGAVWYRTILWVLSVAHGVHPTRPREQLTVQSAHGVLRAESQTP